MGLKYNAFISYRHSEQDSKIAAEVQTHLERFRIPKAIVKRTGIKRFERIFRDKEELPITSDLNEDIDEALANSDNLIVICSTRTSESVWVRKEIETFLKYHKKENIFTVLVDGEPEEVIPDLLLKDTVYVTNPDGTVEAKEEFIEPLSCDYRMDIKKARRVELPRLAASMLGCSYDELIQRRRQYIRRRNSIIGLSAAALLAAIIGYLSWSLLQIRMNYELAQTNYELAQSNLQLAQANYEQAQANYMDSLANQSRYLAAESADLLSKGDRVSAVILALAALPSDEMDRPVITEAEFALSSSLGAYCAPDPNSLAAVWKYSSGHEIIKMRLYRGDTKILSVLDKMGDISIWNLRDRNLITVIPTSGDTGRCDFLIDTKGRIITCDEETITSYDTDYETVLWTIEVGDNMDPGYGNKDLKYFGEEIGYVYFGDSYLAFFDADTGVITEEHDLMEEIPESENSLEEPALTDIRISPDGRYVAAASMWGIGGRTIFILDREDGTWSQIDRLYDYIDAMEFSEDGNLIVVYDDDIWNSSSYMNGADILIESERTIIKMDPETLNILWSAKTNFTMYDYKRDLIFVDYKISDTETVKAVVALFSNKVLILNDTTGEVIDEKELPSGFIKCFAASSGNGLFFVVRDGNYIYLGLSPDGSFVSYDYFAEELDDVDVYDLDDNNHFLAEYNKRDIIEYSTAFYDPSYTPVDGACGSGYFCDSLVAGNRIYIVSADMILYCVNAENNTLEWSEPIDGSNALNVHLLCSDKDGNIYLKNQNRLSSDELSTERIYKISPEGDFEELKFWPDYSMKLSFDEKLGLLYCYTQEYSDFGYGIYTYDIDTGEEKHYPIDSEHLMNTYPVQMSLSPDLKNALFLYNSYNGVGVNVVNLESGRVIGQVEGEYISVSWNKSGGGFAFATKSEVVFYDLSGTKLYSVSGVDAEVVIVDYYEDDLIVLYSSGLAVRYDDKGNMVASTECYLGVTVADRTRFELHGDEIVILAEGVANVISLEDFKVRAWIADYLGYVDDCSRYYVSMADRSSGSCQYVAVSYERKSIEELIELAKEYIGDATMSDEQKERYGILY